jgi:hypothetical protein
MDFPGTFYELGDLPDFKELFWSGIREMLRFYRKVGILESKLTHFQDSTVDQIFIE